MKNRVSGEMRVLALFLHRCYVAHFLDFYFLYGLPLLHNQLAVDIMGTLWIGEQH